METGIEINTARALHIIIEKAIMEFNKNTGVIVSRITIFPIIDIGKSLQAVVSEIEYKS